MVLCTNEPVWHKKNARNFIPVEQSMRFCSLSEMSSPVAANHWPSRAPVVENAQLDTQSLWFLIGVTYPLSRQSTATGPQPGKRLWGFLGILPLSLRRLLKSDFFDPINFLTYSALVCNKQISLLSAQNQVTVELIYKVSVFVHPHHKGRPAQSVFMIVNHDHFQIFLPNCAPEQLSMLVLVLFS